MKLMEKKIGLPALTSIVIGSQIGSGIFMLPQLLAPYGKFAVIGWCLSGIGALCLAFLFMGLVKRLPKTGGPHVYIQHVFGKSPAFFVGWAYWLASSLSSATVIAATISYLSPILNIQSPVAFMTCELALLGIVIIVNLQGIQSVSVLEILLNLIKFITLLVIPTVGLYYFSMNNANMMTPTMTNHSNLSLMCQSAALTLWAFLGVEAGTAPAESVKNPSSTIPKAILIGTCCVIALYLLNSIAFIGLIPPSELAGTTTPYVLATQKIFGGNWHLIIALFAALVCISNLNAWILTSGQIALGLANDGLLPRLLKNKNRFNAPVVALLATATVIVFPILVTIDDDISKQVFAIIDLAIQTSIFIYLFCGASLVCILRQEKKPWYHYEYIVTGLACLFCLFILANSHKKTLLFSSLFFISGYPVYWFWLCKQPQD